MKNRPIHENLDTSFVNLSALLRYLRRRQFAGSIRIELNGYEADILLTAENQMKVKEYDRIAGRIAEGEDVLQRLLIRAREPGGVIHVYQTVAENAVETVVKTETVKALETVETARIPKPKIELPKADVIKTAVSLKPAVGNLPEPEKNGAPRRELAPAVDSSAGVHHSMPRSSVKAAKLPFELSNKVESKAKQNQLSPQDWQAMVGLIGELLKTFDDCLATVGLDFSAAFQKAGQEISADYPFLHPISGSLTYQDGKVTMTAQISPKLFAASINETLRRILEKLSANPKFAAVYLLTTHKLIALIHHRKPFYDNFSITPQLEKNLGV